jgi:DNA-binding MarR family transcriptional regulator
VKTRDDQTATDTLLATSRLLVAIAIRGLHAGSPEVTVAQHRVLVLLDERSPLSITEVADLLRVDQSNASRHCLRLEDLGLVGRDRAEQDGRTVEVRLTRAGRDQIDNVREARRHEIATILSGMSDQEVRDATAALAIFNAAATTR